MRLLSLCSHALLALVDLFSPRHLRARRREQVYVLIHRLIGLRFRLLDWVLPDRRRAIVQRARAIAVLEATKARSAISGEATPAIGVSQTTDGDASVTGLKIAVFIPSFLRGQGGAEKVAGQVANVLSEAGATVHLFCREQDAATPAYSVEKNIRICLLDERDDERIQQYRQERYDLLVCFGMAHFYRRIPHIANLLDAPFVIQECTNPVSMTRLLHRLSDAHSERDAYWLRQAVLTQAAAVRFTMQNYARSVEAGIQPFSYAFFNAFRRPTICNPAMPDEPERKFVCVGAMKNINKNGIAAVKAFVEFAERHDSWRLSLYGANNFREEAERVLSAHGAKRVHDEGITSDLSEIYAKAYALIIPSFEEGLPNVVVEAFSFGVPCIGFKDCEGVAQLVQHGETGLLVDRGDPQGLLNALEQIIDSDVREKLSDGARKFAEQHFDFVVWRRCWLQLVHNAANGLNNCRTHQQPDGLPEDLEVGENWARLLDSYRVVA